MIIIKSITKETFKDLLEMYKRQGIKVTNKIVDDEFISYVAEGFQYIYTKDIKEFPVDLIVSDSDLYEESLYLNDLNGFINETKNINRKFMVESNEIKPGLKFDFSNKEKNVMPDVKIGDSRISYGYSDGKLHIYSLRTPVNKRGSGSARSAMQQFLKQSDNEGLDVYLDSSPLDNKTNGNKLLQFYKSLGFEETGKKINPVGDPEMVRKAKGRINESVELIAKDYIKCHGKNPAGIGTWIFGIGSKKSSDWVEFKGKFSEAKKQAIKQAEEKSVSKIYVMESLSNENIDLHYDIKLNDKGYRVAIIKENNEIAVTQAITLSSAKSIAKRMIHNILIDTVPTKSEFNIKEFKESVNKFKNINESSDDPNIGRKWMNRYGQEIEIESLKDGKYYTLVNGKAIGGEIIPSDQLERTIKVDTSWYNKKLETDKELADQKAADLATKLAKDTEYSGIKGSSKLDTGRKIKALDKKLRLYSGEILTVKQIIDREIQNGAKLEVHNFWNDRLGKSVPETVLMSLDDTYFSEKNIGKIGLEYARQLLNSINEDLIQKTEQSIRTPFKAIKVDSYYMIKDNLGQYLHGEYTKEDADNLVKQLNAIGNVQFSINESVDDVNLVKQKAMEALHRLEKSVSEFSLTIDFNKTFEVDDNDTPVVFRTAAAIQEIKNLGWNIIDGESAEYSKNDSSSYLVVKKDDVIAKIRISNHSNTTNFRDYPDVNIAPNEDTVWDIEDRLLIKYEDEHELDESINESVKSFEIKYRSTSDSSKTEGSKVITAPDQNVARKRFTEDNPELKNLQIISITEVTDKI